MAVGKGNIDSIAYSSDGINWIGAKTSAGGPSTDIFQHFANGVAWNGKVWVAVGDGDAHSIAYSSDVNGWTGATGTNGSTTTIFSYHGLGVDWNGKQFVAVGSGTGPSGGGHSIAYSSDGINWAPATGPTGSSKSIFSEYGVDIAWNGIRWVAVGQGTDHTIAHSSDGINWNGLGKTIFDEPNNTSPTGSSGNGVAGNPNVGATIVDSVITLNKNTNKLDIVADNYYNTGFSEFSIDIIANESN
jgi:hypothetical protein